MMVDELQESRTALVIGANGIVGKNMLEYLGLKTRWKCFGVARSRGTAGSDFGHISVDLLDSGASKRAMAEAGDVDYVFFAALAVAPTPVEQVESNLAMLRNAVTPLLDLRGRLRHVCLVQGTKWYGSHLGAYRTPAREGDPRHEGPNFYYDQHDWLSEHQRGQPWTYSTLRPHFVSGFNIGNPNNLMVAITVYAEVQRALGKPLDFPGTVAAFDALTMVTDVSLLNDGMLWAATSPQCANHDFNITNGDYFRWRNVWPQIAAALGMEAGAVVPLRLAEYMPDKAVIWERIVHTRDLRRISLDLMVSWTWADFFFRGEWDDMSSTMKARKFGFDRFIDTEDDFLSTLARYRAERVLP